MYGPEFQPRSLCNVQKGAAAVREIENPQHGQLIDFCMGLATNHRIESPSTQLWFTFGILIQVWAVVLEHMQHCPTFSERICQRLGLHETKIVRRRVVFWI